MLIVLYNTSWSLDRRKCVLTKGLTYDTFEFLGYYLVYEYALQTVNDHILYMYTANHIAVYCYFIIEYIFTSSFFFK